MNENSDEASIQRKKLVSARLVRPGFHAYIESRGVVRTDQRTKVVVRRMTAPGQQG